MNDLDRAIADSLHALNFHPHPETETTIIEAEYRRCLHNILAALDAARGQAVAWALPKALAETRASGFTVVREGHPHHADGSYCVPLYAAPPAALAVPPTEAWLVAKYYEWERLNDGSPLFVFLRREAAKAQQPAAAAVPAANVTPMRQPRADLARLVESINAAVYANGDGLSVTEAIGALELAKLELLKEQEQ